MVVNRDSTPYQIPRKNEAIIIRYCTGGDPTTVNIISGAIIHPGI